MHHTELHPKQSFLRKPSRVSCTSSHTSRGVSGVLDFLWKAPVMTWTSLWAGRTHLESHICQVTRTPAASPPLPLPSGDHHFWALFLPSSVLPVVLATDSSAVHCSPPHSVIAVPSDSPPPPPLSPLP
eukprot:Sspe_Gene.34538::Locus_16781_Transcript_1_1_Confidence_1.000_Length_1445::g.34538::m.34538